MVRARLRILATLVGLPFVVLLGQLGRLELDPASHERYRALSEHRSGSLSSPARGRILARDGTILAGNRPVFHLQFRYRELNLRLEPLVALVEELGRRGPFPLADDVVARMRQLADAGLLAASPAGDETAEWLLLVDRVEPESAGALERRWRKLPAVFQVRRPRGSGPAEVWFHRRRALEMEITLHRLAALLGGEPRQALARIEERVAQALLDVERGVDAEAGSDRRKGRAEPDIRKASRNRRWLYYGKEWRLASDVPLSVVTAIEYHPERFRGIRCVDGVERHYTLGAACGTLTGHLRLLSGDEKDRLRGEGRLLDRFSPEETLEEFHRRRLQGFPAEGRVGATGLEQEYDERLRGLAGRTVFSLDPRNQPWQLIEELPPQAGEDIQTTLDAPLQMLLHEALEAAVASRQGTGASVAVMDVDSGALLASAGHPAVDPNRLREVGYDDEMKARWGENHWHLDRPSRHALYPGSVFKLVLAAAALESGHEPARRYPCNGSFDQIPALRCRDGGHGTPDQAVDLLEALQYSCNNYFYDLGLKLRPEAIHRWADAFGYGRHTGVDLPRKDVFERGLLHEDVTTKTEVCHYAIGQVHVEATPLQVLRAVAAIAAGGKSLPTPYLVTRSAPEPLALQPRTVAVLREGMWRAGHAPQGTASRAELGLSRFNAAYKTGTAEVEVGGRTLHHAWLVGFAPFDKPRIAFVIVIERVEALHGAEACAPIASKLLEHQARADPASYFVEPRSADSRGAD